jgi:hypothetical protein
MLYFSLTTLTTTGYGDIVPVDPFARSLACMRLLKTPSTFNAISSRDRRSGPSEPRRRTNGGT